MTNDLELHFPSPDTVLHTKTELPTQWPQHSFAPRKSPIQLRGHHFTSSAIYVTEFQKLQTVLGTSFLSGRGIGRTIKWTGPFPSGQQKMSSSCILLTCIIGPPCSPDDSRMFSQWLRLVSALPGLWHLPGESNADLAFWSTCYSPDTHGPAFSLKRCLMKHHKWKQS